MRDPPATSSGPPASAPPPAESLPRMRWGELRGRGGSRPALIQEWGLTPAEVRLIDRQQGLCCAACHSNLRSMTLAAALLREYGPGQTLAEFVALLGGCARRRLLEINQAGTLTPWLSLFRHYTFVQYPDTDMQNLKIADESFDIVVHSDTLEHVPDPVRGLRECRRVLRPGGKLLFTIPIVPSRLTRRRAGLPPSYHGNHANSHGIHGLQRVRGGLLYRPRCRRVHSDSPPHPGRLEFFRHRRHEKSIDPADRLKATPATALPQEGRRFPPSAHAAGPRNLNDRTTSSTQVVDPKGDFHLGQVGQRVFAAAVFVEVAFLRGRSPSPRGRRRPPARPIQRIQHLLDQITA